MKTPPSSTTRVTTAAKLTASLLLSVAVITMLPTLSTTIVTAEAAITSSTTTARHLTHNGRRSHHQQHDHPINRRAQTDGGEGVLTTTTTESGAVPTTTQEGTNPPPLQTTTNPNPNPNPINYNINTAPCPGYQQYTGYTTLSSLQTDLSLYFRSFTTLTPTSSPTFSPAPTTGTRVPTTSPSSSPINSPTVGPSSSPTLKPTDFPTRAPITLRPTPFPTSSIRIVSQGGTGGQSMPTASPVPTIEMVVHSSGSAGDVGVGGGSEGSGILTSPPDDGGGSDGGDGNTLDAFMGNRKLSTSKNHHNEHQHQHHHQRQQQYHRSLQGEVGTGIPGNAYDSTLQTEGGAFGLMDEVQTTTSSNTQAVGEAVTTTTLETTTTTTLESNGGEVVGEDGTTTTTSGSKLDLQLSTTNEQLLEGGGGGGGGDGIIPNASTTPQQQQQQTLTTNELLAGESATHHQTISTSTSSTTPTVSFQICPNSKFDFKDTFSLVEYPPLLLEMPLLEHSIEIGCIELKEEEGGGGEEGGDGANKCVFSGGNVQLLFKHHQSNDDSEDNFDETGTTTTDGSSTQGNHQQNNHHITISNITFRNAQKSSILMQDPRGKVLFDHCTWEDNVGNAAIVIDGRYESPSSSEDDGDDGNEGGGEGGEEQQTTTSSTLDFSIMEMSTTTNMGDLNVGLNGGRKLATNGGTEEGDDEVLSLTAPTPKFDNHHLSDDTTTTEEEEEEEYEDFGYENDFLLLMMEDDDDDTEIIMTIDQEEEEMMMMMMQNSRNMRWLEAESVPRSIISIEHCRFSGNKGNATIMVSSYSDELTLAEQDPGVLTHNDDLLNGDSTPSSGGGGMLRRRRLRTRRTTRLDRNLDTFALQEEQQQQQEEANSESASTTMAPPLAHSIHLSIKDTTFTSENVDTSIIENYGGRLQSSNNVFANNSAESIIRSEYGTVAITATEFTSNEMKGGDNGGGGGGGMVVLDSESALELNEDSCVGGGSGDNNNAVMKNNAADESTMDSFNSERQAGNAASNVVVDGEEGILSSSTLAETASANNGTAAAGGTSPVVSAPPSNNNNNNHCDGIKSGGICNSFELCSTIHPTSAKNETATTPGGITQDGQEGASTSCFSAWDDLVIAVRDRPTQINQPQRDFIICPGATLIATPNNPVIINSDYVTIQCGTELKPSKDCVIEGGYSQFHIVGSVAGVQLARLKLKSSTGSSIMALGTGGSTLNFKECEWMENVGASVILIYNDGGQGDGLTNAAAAAEAGTGTGIADGGATTLDIMSLLGDTNSTVSTAMSVEVIDCTFGMNELNFGAITNIGGILTVHTSKFAENSSRGGDIVVANKGSCSVQGSCFDASSSVAPGIIFIENGSELTGNTDNFGYDITAGGYMGVGGTSTTCAAVFQESVGADCLGSSNCSGKCMPFSSTKCTAGLNHTTIVGNTPTVAPAIYVPAYSRSDEGSGSSKIVPIVVATMVCAFIVLGLVGIIMRRRKLNKKTSMGSDDNDEQSSSGGGGGGGKCCFCCKGKGDKSSAYDDGDEEVENGGGGGGDADDDGAL